MDLNTLGLGEGIYAAKQDQSDSKPARGVLRGAVLKTASEHTNQSMALVGHSVEPGSYLIGSS
jgi:hypothetical protein